MPLAKKESQSAVLGSVERIRNLLEESKFYDPDATTLSNEFEDEGNWTTKDLITPGLKNAARFIEEQDNSAFAAVKKIREDERQEHLQEISRYDFDGSLMSLYRIWSLIPPTYKMSRKELAQMLARRVIFNQDDLIAINKPYGISSRFSDTEGGRLAIESAFTELKQLIAPNSDYLHILHRLDKTTTGVLLIAASRLRASEMIDMYNKKKIEKKYWALVRNVPEPQEGIIDIPLREAKVGGRFKVVPVVHVGQNLEELGRRPMVDDESEALEKKRTPITNYEVIRLGHQCALVECTTKTGFTHQIRCHLGFGLNTPILGDHKYSHFLDFKPQRLPPNLLQGLGIRSAKSRAVPMHLHAREVVIPEFKNGQNLFIKCLLPKYFVYVMKKLKLPLKK